MIWFRNTHGKRDATLTLATATLTVVLIRTLIAGVAIGSFTFPAGPDAGTIAALLGPTLGAYWARRNRVLGGGAEEPKP